MQTELAEQSGIPLPTVSRLMATLENHGYVARRTDGRYVRGAALYRLSFELDPQGLVRDMVRRQVRLLRDATEETAGYYVRDRLERFCVETAASEEFLRRTLSVHVRRPLFVGSAGKVFIAFAETGADALLELMRREEISVSGSQIERLRTECRRVRERGWAVSQGEVAPEAWGVAAPVFVGGVLIGALATTAPKERRSEARIAEHGAVCKAQADELTERLTSALRGNSAPAQSAGWAAAPPDEDPDKRSGRL